MSRGYTTPQDRSRRRKATVVVVVGVVLVVGWITAIAAFAGGSNGSRQGGAEGAASDRSGQQQASANAASADASADASAETTAEQDPEDSSGEDAAQPSSTDQGEAPEGGEADPRQVVAGGTQTQEVFDPLEEEEKGSSGEPDRSTGGEQAQPGGLSETDRTRARAASERYIVAAYGYTGGSEDAYLEGIEQVASEEIYNSPGGAMLEGYSKAAPDCGMRSTAILEEFEVLGQSPEGLDVAVTFSVEDADGQTHQFSQNQRLSSSNGTYEVSGVSVEELISETTPKESCPGGKSKDASDGSSEAEVKPDEISEASLERERSGGQTPDSRTKKTS